MVERNYEHSPELKIVIHGCESAKCNQCKLNSERALSVCCTFQLFIKGTAKQLPERQVFSVTQQNKLFGKLEIK